MTRRFFAKSVDVVAGKLKCDDDQIVHRTKTDEGVVVKASKGFRATVREQYKHRSEHHDEYPKAGTVIEGRAATFQTRKAIFPKTGEGRKVLMSKGVDAIVTDERPPAPSILGLFSWRGKR